LVKKENPGAMTNSHDDTLSSESDDIILGDDLERLFLEIKHENIVWDDAASKNVAKVSAAFHKACAAGDLKTIQQLVFLSCI
jgi:hypothetical protein